MSSKVIVPVFCLLSLFLSSQIVAAECLTDQCHQNLAATKYIHGPVAAELAGGMGCVACHVPAGEKCSASKGGSFKPMISALQMCQLCHLRGTGSQHTSEKIECLKCHDPHGSDSGHELKR